MPDRPDPSDILAVARVSRVPIDQTTAERIARSIGPAIETFDPGALPFDLEPSSYVAEQMKETDL